MDYFFIRVLSSFTCNRGLGAEELAADTVARTVSVHKTLFLLASSLLIVGISKESIGTSTDGFVSPR